MKIKKNIIQDAGQVFVNDFETVKDVPAEPAQVQDQSGESPNDEDLQAETPINAALIDSNTYTRIALKDIIPPQRLSITIDGEFNAAMQQHLLNNCPDVIIVGGDADSTQSIDTVKWIHNNIRESNIIYLSETDNKEHILSILKEKVNAIIFRKKYSPQQVLSEILSIIEDEREFIFDDHITRIMLDSLTIQKANEGKIVLPKTLTEREIEIIRQIALERKTSDIATDMKLSTRTLEGLLNGIFTKMSVTSRVGLTIKAIRAGLID